MMKYKLLTAALTLIAAQTAFSAVIADPFPCPSVRTLKSVGVSSVMWHPLGGPGEEWAGIERNNNYYTGVDWTFIIEVSGLKDKPKNEILASTNAAISNLILEGGPYPISPADETFPDNYYCEYFTNDGSHTFAVAITPTVNLDKPLPLKLRKR